MTSHNDWRKRFDEEFKFRSDVLSKDGNYDATVLRNELVEWIEGELLKAKQEGYEEGLGGRDDAIVDGMKLGAREERERIRKIVTDIQKENDSNGRYNACQEILDLLHD